jgi:hypothetical protein
MNLASMKMPVMNFFILSLLSFFGFLVAREFYPLAYPGLTEKLFWLSLVSGIFTAVLYSPSIYQHIHRIIPKGKFMRYGDKLNKLFGSEAENSTRVRLNGVFQIFLLSFLLITLIRQYIEFAEFINPTYLLLAVVFFGVLSFIYPPGEDVFRKNKPVKKDYYLAVFLGIAGTLLVGYKVQGLGTIGYFISIVSGLLIILLSVLILEEE